MFPQQGMVCCVPEALTLDHPCPISQMGRKTLRVTHNVTELGVCLVRLQQPLVRAPAGTEAAAPTNQACIQLPHIVPLNICCPILQVEAGWASGEHLA